MSISRDAMLEIADLMEPFGPVVVVGSAPSRPGAPPWDPSAGSTARLAALAGCAPGEVAARFGLSNLLGSWSGCKAPSREDLREAAAAFTLVPGFRYLLAGTEVVRALGARALPRREPGEISWSLRGGGAPLLCWYDGRCGARLAVFPHPSGRNRWYNDGRRLEAARRFVRSCAWCGPGLADELWRGQVAA